MRETLRRHLEEIKAGRDVEPLIGEIENVNLEGLSPEEISEIGELIGEIIRCVEERKAETLRAVETLFSGRNSLKAYGRSGEVSDNGD